MNINTTMRARRLHTYASGKRPQVRGIVLHDTAGSGTIGDAKYLANDPENRKVSVDFVILRDGEIFQLNPDLTSFSTNHAGRNTNFRGLHNADVNAHSIGIEISHNAVPKKQDPEWPVPQVEAVAQLCKKLCGDFNLTRDDITTHALIITDGTRSDPRNFDWPLFWHVFDNHSETPMPEAVPNADGQTFHVVKKDETMYSLAKLYDTTVEVIKALNHYETPSTLITEGQRLLVRVQ